MKRKITISIFLVVFLLSAKGCILEDFETLPINIPVSLPIILLDDGSQTMISSEAEFRLDSIDLYQDYQGKIKKMTLHEIAFRFTEVFPADISGNMEFILRQTNIQGGILIDQELTAFTPQLYLIPNTPFIKKLDQSEVDLMNAYLTANGTEFYGYIAVDNLTPANTPKIMRGYVDMLFKAEIKF